jgi:Mg2+ and Co2+ transporter CorA
MELLSNLLEQIDVIKTLTLLTRRERDALVNRDIPLLQSCRQEREQLQKNLAQLEQQRISLCRGLTLREIAAEPDAPAAELLHLRSTLKTALRELKSEHDTNTLFYKQEVAYLSLIRKAIAQETNAPNYTKNGAMAPQNKSAMLSKRA